LADHHLILFHFLFTPTVGSIGDNSAPVTDLIIIREKFSFASSSEFCVKRAFNKASKLAPLPLGRGGMIVSGKIVSFNYPSGPVVAA
jgi:hypothetical protein